MIAEGAPLPDLAFAGVDERGVAATLRLERFRAAEGEAGLLLVSVHGGAWCGTCVTAAPEVPAIVRAATDDASRVARLDLILRDVDGAQADAADARAWWRDVTPGVAVGVDPAFVFAGAAAHPGGAARLPLFALVDTRDLRVAQILERPGPVELTGAIAAALAAIDGEEPPASPEEPLIDERFDAFEWRMIADMGRTPGAPPPDPTNAAADAPAAAALGEALFFDAGLSPAGDVACASCHQPALGFGDDRARAVGVGQGTRRAPAIALAAHARWQGWDGRADTLWAQALGPLESAHEMGSSRVFVARRVLAAHGDAYRAAFPSDGQPDVARWPARGAPGDADWEGLSPADRDDVTEVFVHAGKALAAYERSLRVAPNRLDAYAAGDRDALDADEKYGLSLFLKSGCAQCHWGPRLTDDAFHDTHAPSREADPGRELGLALWRESEFRADRRWSDAPARARPAATVGRGPALGQFKTPALRGVADARFFGHDGSETSLTALTERYGRGGEPAALGARDPWLVGFGETAEWGLVPFLEVLGAR